MTKEYKDLLGLEDTQKDPDKFEKEQFISDFQEISQILQSINAEV